jgi:hypothetical protein
MSMAGQEENDPDDNASWSSSSSTLSSLVSGHPAHPMKVISRARPEMNDEGLHCRSISGHHDDAHGAAHGESNRRQRRTSVEQIACEANAGKSAGAHSNRTTKKILDGFLLLDACQGTIILITIFFIIIIVDDAEDEFVYHMYIYIYVTSYNVSSSLL